MPHVPIAPIRLSLPLAESAGEKRKVNLWAVCKSSSEVANRSGCPDWPIMATHARSRAEDRTMSRRLSYLLTVWITLAASCCAQNGTLNPAFSSSRYAGFAPRNNATTAGNMPIADANYATFGGHTDISMGQQFLTSPGSVSAGNNCAPQYCAPAVCEPCNRSSCDVCGRNIAVDVSAAFFHRSRPEPQTLVVSPTNALQQINGDDFEFGVTPGIEAGIIAYDVAPLLDIELRATWLEDWTARTSATFTGTTVGISASPPLGTSGPRNGFTIYDSRFLSTELNARYRPSNRCKDITFLLGIRSMRLDERLNITLADPNGVLPNELAQARSNNRLVGLQLGVDKVFANRCNWCLKFTGRAGLYGNNGHQRSQLISLATPPVTFPASGGEGDHAFHAELGVSGKFRLSSCANIIASYRAMFIDGVALASDQLAATNFLTSSGYSNSRSVMLHAATVGLEFVY